MERPERDRGQATIELVASLPIVLLAALVAFQILAAGFAHAVAGGAAEAGALAVAGGSSAKEAASLALPGWARASARVTSARGHVEVNLAAPSPLAVIGAAPRVSADAWVRADETRDAN